MKIHCFKKGGRKIQRQAVKVNLLLHIASASHLTAVSSFEKSGRKKRLRSSGSDVMTCSSCLSILFPTATDSTLIPAFLAATAAL